MVPWILLSCRRSLQKCFPSFLDEVAKRHCRELIVMFLDKAGLLHTAKALTIPENIRLCYLPPYSPELNPAEHLWDEIRDLSLPNLVFHHMDGVEDAVSWKHSSPWRIIRTECGV